MALALAQTQGDFAAGALAIVTGLREQYLHAMGMPVWIARRGGGESSGDASVEGAVADDEWAALQHEVSDCTRCPLHRGRRQTVFGVGARDASLLIVGEAPGAEEDRRGEPFVGPAGQLLTAMLKAIKLSREAVYIANVLKCRPPNNRDPEAAEAEVCTAYLERQIDLIQPKLILAVGRIAGQWLTGSTAPLGKLRLGSYTYGKGAVPLLVTYHPAYLLRSPGQKSLAWEDLKRVRDQLAVTE